MQRLRQQTISSVHLMASASGAASLLTSTARLSYRLIASINRQNRQCTWWHQHRVQSFLTTFLTNLSVHLIISWLDATPSTINKTASASDSISIECSLSDIINQQLACLSLDNEYCYALSRRYCIISLQRVDKKFLNFRKMHCYSKRDKCD